MDTSFLSVGELAKLGLSKYGQNVLVSRKASIYSPELIEIGSNVRIDDFCVLSGKISLGSFIHVSAFCALYGACGIVMEDYSGLSARTTIYSTSDDFGGGSLIGPMVPANLRKLKKGQVTLRQFVQIGAGCVVVPDVTIGEGSVVGAMSFVNDSLDGWGIYAGIPARRIRTRKREILTMIGQSGF